LEGANLLVLDPWQIGLPDERIAEREAEFIQALAKESAGVALAFFERVVEQRFQHQVVEPQGLAETEPQHILAIGIVAMAADLPGPAKTVLIALPHILESAVDAHNGLVDVAGPFPICLLFVSLGLSAELFDLGVTETGAFRNAYDARQPDDQGR